MNNENHIAETIERYLDGVMSEHERIAFEQLLQNDENLARLLEETKLTNEALHLAHLADLKKGIAVDLKNIPHKPSTSLPPLFLVLMSLLVVSASVYYFNNTQTPSLPEKNSNITQKREDSSSPHKEVNNVIEESKQQDENNTASNPLPRAKTTAATDTINQVQPTASDRADTSKQTQPTVLPVDSNKYATPISTTIDSTDTKTVTQAPDCEASFTLSITPSCKENATGAITIKNDSHGNYTLSFINDPASTYLNTVNNLSAGSYDLVIVQEECTYQKTVKVEEKWCPLNSSYSFNPDYNETWEIQYEEGDQGSFIIYNSQGREIYTANFGNGNEYWDGRDTHGNLVEVGNYLVMMQYNDGRLEKVELTIVR